MHALRCDPKKKGLLYLGSERGVRTSTDDGLTWQELKLNLPTVAVTDLKVKGDDLVLSTNGRSIWVFDDLTPLREWTPERARAEAYLLPVQPAQRWRYTEKQVEERFFGKGFANPPAGAVIHYGLLRKPKDDVTLEILDDKGTLVRTLSSRPEPEEKPGEEGDYSAPEENRSRCRRRRTAPRRLGSSLRGGRDHQGRQAGRRQTARRAAGCARHLHAPVDRGR